MLFLQLHPYSAIHRSVHRATHTQNINAVRFFIRHLRVNQYKDEKRRDFVCENFVFTFLSNFIEALTFKEAVYIT